MKPKFLNVIRLAVLLIAIMVVVGTTIHSYDGCKATVDSVGYAMQAGDGVSGPLGWIWGWFTWFTYIFFIGFVTLVVVLVLHAFRVFGMLVGAFGGGIVWIRNVWSPPIALDTVIDKSSSGAPITLGQVLTSLTSGVKSLKETDKRLLALTAGLQPPPPPKSASEIAAEKDAEIAAMNNRMAALERELKLARSVAPVPTPAPAPTTGGAA